ncbi:MAG: hypothetical protein EKK37_04450 [Sphingobacteriales bacterium]|jgi:hypothetical protein|nr:MAG: hypothetical protein EKK37_04450 [Sphingobacteriales bacterium]
MKTLTFLLLASAIILWACNSFGKDEVKDFIPGTYIRSSEHEFGAEHDTLIISVQNAGANEYKIERRFRYDRVLDGKPIEPEYKQTINSAIYNAETKMLQESSTLETYSFDTKQKFLFAGTTKYQKLK